MKVREEEMKRRGREGLVEFDTGVDGWVISFVGSWLR